MSKQLLKKLPSLLHGSYHKDDRGKICFINEFDFSNIKRFYTIEHNNLNTIRAWQGHQYEHKYFFAVNGEFTIYTLMIDNWEAPDKDIEPLTFYLSESEVSILIVPGGYVTGIINNTKAAKLVTFSNFSLDETKNDDYRFDKDYFNKVDWK